MANSTLVRPTEISTLSGTTSSIQNQLNTISSTLASDNTTLTNSVNTINTTLTNFSYFAYRGFNIIKNLTDFQGNVYFGTNTDNTSDYITSNYLSSVILSSPNPSSYFQTISQDISCGSGNVLIATIDILQNQYINMYYTQTLDFN
jgi:hypothetical protein